MNEWKRFWSYVDVRGPKDCWLWTGTISGPENNRAYFRADNRLQIAARWYWQAHHGVVLDPKTEWVLHINKCNNPACLNLRHLYIGPPKKNSADREAAGHTMRGSGHKRARLVEDEVLEIRRLWAAGTSGMELSRQFGVGSSTIYNIVHRRTWTHI